MRRGPPHLSPVLSVAAPARSLDAASVAARRGMRRRSISRIDAVTASR
jgi:hypothetical protein